MHNNFTGSILSPIISYAMPSLYIPPMQGCPGRFNIQIIPVWSVHFLGWTYNVHRGEEPVHLSTCWFPDRTWYDWEIQPNPRRFSKYGCRVNWRLNGISSGVLARRNPSIHNRWLRHLSILTMNTPIRFITSSKSIKTWGQGNEAILKISAFLK